MSAEILRRAAALMRERAEAAQNYDDNDLSWTCIPTLDPDNNGWVVTHDPSHADYDTTVAQAIYDYEGFVSRHIASWHPAVAIVVADWLDDVAVDIDEWDDLQQVGFAGKMHTRALVVARAYLGEAES